MHFYITLTTECNLTCRYCYGKCCNDFGSNFDRFKIDYDLPNTISYDLMQLKDFLKKDPKADIIFYGGEPLLEPEKVKEIMDQLPNRKYLIQTNGILLDRLEFDYIRRFHTLLVSIDGDKTITDFYRGKGTYLQVIKNLKMIKDSGFTGEIIARMTVMKETDIYRQIRFLLFNKNFNFSSIHWQLDVLFWKNDYDRPIVSRWLNSYNRQIDRLITFWLDTMKHHRTVLRLYPLIGVMHSLLHQESDLLRCGAGWTIANIQTNGMISPCPVMAGMKDFYLGSIQKTHPAELKKVYIANPCPDCPEYASCGGRCLYANITKLWGDEGYQAVCSTVHHLITSLRRIEPIVRSLIARKVIRIEDFNYPKYNSCEIIP